MIPNNAITVENLTKTYGAKTAVDKINLAIHENELFALLGVNGAGKTTTIRMLSCLSSPTSGTAEILGHDVQKDPEAVKALIGISTQDTAVAENLTVEENLRFMAGIFGKDEDEATEKAVNAFHLEEVRKKRAKTLSGGWKRKLSIAMAIISEPKILYLDEPTLGLDVLARRELWKIIKELKKHMTVILTTHYMEEAEMLADRIALMIDGSIVCTGTLSELESLTGQTGLENVFVYVAENGGLR
jgi:ABC-2 type transport system ATP-binding protein